MYSEVLPYNILRCNYKLKGKEPRHYKPPLLQPSLAPLIQLHALHVLIFVLLISILLAIKCFIRGIKSLFRVYIVLRVGNSIVRSSISLSSSAVKYLLICRLRVTIRLRVCSSSLSSPSRSSSSSCIGVATRVVEGGEAKGGGRPLIIA
jgi:hypothetical protein